MNKLLNVLVFGFLLLTSNCSRGTEEDISSKETPHKDEQITIVAEGKGKLKFEVTGVWRPKCSIIQAGVGNQKYTISPKNGNTLLAVELLLKKDDPKHPIPAAMWNGVSLIDSSGQTQQTLFSYASTLLNYTQNGDLIEYDQGDRTTGEVIGANLVDLGGKMVSVFTVPAGKSYLRIKIEGEEQPIDLTKFTKRK